MTYGTKEFRDKCRQKLKAKYPLGRDAWTCYKCGKTYRARKNVGLTNSITDKSLCINCYNKGGE